jgi:hypothetical protein
VVSRPGLCGVVSPPNTTFVVPLYGSTAAHRPEPKSKDERRKCVRSIYRFHLREPPKAPAINRRYSKRRAYCNNVAFRMLNTAFGSSTILIEPLPAMASWSAMISPITRVVEPGVPWNCRKAL